MRWSWSPTAARCCSSAITATKIRSTSAPRRTTQRTDRKDREIKTDAPGTTKQSGGYGRSTYEETDFQQQEEDRWIKDAADELKARVLRNDFEALAIVAPPKALGVLKKCLHKEVERRDRLHRQQGNERPPDPRHRGAAEQRYQAAKSSELPERAGQANRSTTSAFGSDRTEQQRAVAMLRARARSTAGRSASPPQDASICAPCASPREARVGRRRCAPCRHSRPAARRAAVRRRAKRLQVHIVDARFLERAAKRRSSKSRAAATAAARERRSRAERQQPASAARNSGTVVPS